MQSWVRGWVDCYLRLIYMYENVLCLNTFLVPQRVVEKDCLEFPENSLHCLCFCRYHTAVEPGKGFINGIKMTWDWNLPE